MHRVAELVDGHKSKEFLIPKKLFGVWKPHSEWTNFKTGRQKGEEAEIKVEVNSACRCCLPQNGPGVLRLLSSLIISTKVIQSISQWIPLGANEWDTANQADISTEQNAAFALENVSLENSGTLFPVSDIMQQAANTYINGADQVNYANQISANYANIQYIDCF